MSSVDWFCIGLVEDVPKRGSRIVKTPDGDVGVFRTAAGEIFAIEDKCPHKAGPLSQGIVHGNSVTCPLHNLVVNLQTGQGKGPDGGCVKTFPVEIRDDQVFIDISTLCKTKVA